MEKHSHPPIVIIGAGAAGMSAAISCRKRSGNVLLVERLSKPGKKVLASGGGRCNLLNVRFDADSYNREAAGLVSSVFSVFTRERVLDFLKGLGLQIYADGERMFPVTNQAATVVRAFELELERLGVPVEYNFEVAAIRPSDKGLCLSDSSGKSLECSAAIVCGGGRSYPALGSNGSCYRLAQSLGHRIVEPVPSCVALLAHDKLCHHLQGQKINASVSCVVDGNRRARAEGELIFTQYGLSGTAVLDVSAEASVALNREKKKDVRLDVDLVPFMERGALESLLQERIDRKGSPEDLLVGILPNKFGPAMADLLRSRSPSKIASTLKERKFTVTGTRGWNEAEFTRGGVAASEIEPLTLRSKLADNVYFCGEVLDVDGRRGGFNLAWAWASGMAAGEAVAQHNQRGGLHALRQQS
ncbi:MAG: aminoacetone oxidase family FAD-binding enzyme [Deltaproteobacteria bacterium]